MSDKALLLVSLGRIHVWIYGTSGRGNKQACLELLCRVQF